MAHMYQARGLTTLYVSRRFLSQFSTDFDEILPGLFSGHAATTVTFSSKKYYIVQKLDNLICNKFVIMTSLYKPIKLVKVVFSPELYYMPNGPSF